MYSHFSSADSSRRSKRSKHPGLPYPSGTEAFSDGSFYRRGQRSYRGIPVTRACQKMDMIWHYHRSDDMPVKSSYCLAKGGKRVVIVQHVSASFDAEGDKINDA